MVAASHALYRFYSATGQLLYVGITSNPGARFKQHQQDKPWWHDVAGISVEQHESRADALAAEARAIAVENPQHNIQRPSIGKRQALRDARPERRLVWPCAECGEPIADRTGYIHISYVEINAHERAWREFDKTHDGIATASEFLSLPSQARWYAHHLDCDPMSDEPDYWFDVSRARTHAQLLNWTAHLLGKNWIQSTTWDELIRIMAGVDA